MQGTKDPKKSSGSIRSLPTKGEKAKRRKRTATKGNRGLGRASYCRKSAISPHEIRISQLVNSRKGVDWLNCLQWQNAMLRAPAGGTNSGNLARFPEW